MTRDEVFAESTPDRPLFQGDILHGGFAAWWRHPEAVRLERQGADWVGALPFPRQLELKDAIEFAPSDFAMLMPHPCDFAEGEKGESNPYRIVAPVLPITEAQPGVKLIKKQEVVHAVYLPHWRPGGHEHWYVDLRRMTSIDSAFVVRGARVASLTVEAWAFIVDRLVRYFTGVPLDVGVFGREQASLHPDAP